MFKGWISREEEANIPVFNSYDEARKYFQNKYGKDFILETIDYVDGQKCYFHAIVVSWENYRRLQKAMERHETGNLGIDVMASSQPVQILEDGSVHIVH